jgi:hypothetical protein
MLTLKIYKVLKVKLPNNINQNVLYLNCAQIHKLTWNFAKKNRLPELRNFLKTRRNDLGIHN